MEALVEDVVLLGVIYKFPSLCLRVCCPESQVASDIVYQCVPSDLLRHDLVDACRIPVVGMLEC